MHCLNPYEETVYIDIIEADGDTQTIISNRIHPFYVEDKEWVEAQYLVAGDKLLTDKGELSSEVKAIRIESKPLTAYNLTVEEYNNFFIKEINDSDIDSIWVHNCNFKYSPTNKHRKGGWGTEMDLDDTTAAKVLNSSIAAGKQRYGYKNGKLYEFQNDNAGGWYGYPIPGNEAPTSVLRQLRSNGVISNSIYNRMIKGK